MSKVSKAKPAKGAPPENKVLASPTRKFFVEMLTRDIDLMDAIMDLVDNCIDGVHRQNKDSKKSKLYRGYHAELLLNENEFIIKDNCGGIPEDVAKTYAFKMGREDGYKEDENLETVGVYGIGMKRAIFKMGHEAKVISHHADGSFQVTIPNNWATLQGDWFFDFAELNKSSVSKYLKANGTYLEVSNLHRNIKERFQDKSGFVRDLQEKLKQHYGYIIDQGFKITLNGVPILPLKLEILTVDPSSKLEKAIRPYVYASKIDDVDIEVIVGFYRPPADIEEIDEHMNGSFAKSSSENAGVTVLCNDRVVLYANKDFLTGWGDSPVPQYHTQFINIAGVVHFRSHLPIKLPVTTTKRGVDTSSYIYNSTKQRIKEGLKLFTDFTNKWKSPSDERTKLFKSAKTINALAPGQTKSKFVNLTSKKKEDTGKYQIPELPKPADDARDKFVSISFLREKEKVEEMRDYFFDGENTSASEIGGWCFDKMFSQID